MQNRIYWILAVILVLGLGGVLGAAVVGFGSATAIVQAADLPAENRDAGILVGVVLADSPAAKAGLVRGDIIIEVNGTAIDAKSPAANILKDRKVGDKLTLKVLHGDEVRSVEVTLVDQNGKPFIGIVPAFTGRAGFLGTGKMPENGAIKGFNGAHVVEVVAGGPADKAGVKVGDIILKVNDQAVDANNDLAKALTPLKPGASVKLNVQRKGQAAALDLQVTLGDTPDKAGQAYLGIKYQMLPVIGQFQKGQAPGQPQTPKLPKQITAGVVLGEVKTGSPAEKAGLKVKDLVTEVNGKAVATPTDFVNLVNAAKVGDTLILTVTRSGETSPLKIEVVLGANPDQKDQPYLGVTLFGAGRDFPRGLPNNGFPGGRSRGLPQLPGSNSGA